MTKTFLRVKRRRDDPSPPLVFELQTKELSPRKRSRKNDEVANDVTCMLNRASFFGNAPTMQNATSMMGTQDPISISSSGHGDQSNGKKIIFRKVDNTLHKRKGHPDEHLKVVDATVDQCDDDRSEETDNVAAWRKKRSKFNLRMVDTRVVNEKDFWSSHELREDSVQRTKILPSGDRNTENIHASVGSLGMSQLRNRMKQKARIPSNSCPKKSNTHTKGSRIMDPISKLIDDSLQSIHQHSNAQSPTQRIFQHLSLLQNQSNCAGLMKTLINWQCTDGSGTILHVCALMNSVEGAKALCRLYGDAINFHQTDGDGRTAMNVAQETEAMGVVDIIKAHCHDWQTCNGTEEHGVRVNDADSDDFVYDLYCLDSSHSQKHASACTYDSQTTQPIHHVNHQETSQSNQESFSENHHSSCDVASNDLLFSKVCDGHEYPSSIHKITADDFDDSEPVIVNMHGGVGYWVDGELVLDIHDEEDANESEMEDDEYDSNREDCDANEYPDEEDDSDGCYHASIERGTGMTPPRFMNGHEFPRYIDSDDDSSEMDKNHFRNQPIDLNTFDVGETRHHFGSYVQDDDDTESDGEYHGFMCRSANSWSNERIYCETEAYDPDMEGYDS